MCRKNILFDFGESWVYICILTHIYHINILYEMLQLHLSTKAVVSLTRLADSKKDELGIMGVQFGMCMLSFSFVRTH